MEQPELGKKIAELRKSKRWTQEELVDRCNISIRTIQRIEAGEVPPRNYTIKTILGAMDYEIDQISADLDESLKDMNNTDLISRLFLIGVKVTSIYANRNLNIAFVFGIIYFILRFVEGAAEIALFMNDDDIFDNTTYTAIKIALMFCAICFFRGFVIIGELFENSLLKTIASMLIGINVLVIGFDIVSVHYLTLDPEIILLVYSITFGASGIIFGYALTKLEGAMGRVSKLAGVFEIIVGICSLTVIFSIIGQLVIIPAELLEILLIYRAMDILKRNSSKEVLIT